MQPKKITWLLFVGLVVAFGLSLIVVGAIIVSAKPGDTLPPAKQASLDKDATIIAQGLTHAATLPPDLTVALSAIPTPYPTEAPLLGLRSASELAQPFHGYEFKMQNEWSGYVGGKLITIYAGNAGNQPEQGMVIVQADVPGKPDYFRKDIFTPTKEGALTITQVNGLTFTMVTEKGPTLVFDGNTLAFK